MKPMRPTSGWAGGPPALPPEPSSEPAEPSAATAPPATAPKSAGLATTGGGLKAWFERRDPSAKLSHLLGEPRAEAVCLRCCPVLSWEDRLLGFVACYAIGCALSLSSILSFHQLVSGNPTAFAIKYSLGNILALVSTSFLVGFRAQLASMLDDGRIAATRLYLASICLTILTALSHSPVLTLLAMTAQLLALLWYGVTYIPFGRTILRKFVCKWA